MHCFDGQLGAGLVVGVGDAPVLAVGEHFRFDVERVALQRRFVGPGLGGLDDTRQQRQCKQLVHGASFGLQPAGMLATRVMTSVSPSSSVPMKARTSSAPFLVLTTPL